MSGRDIFYSCFKRNSGMDGKPAIEVSIIAVNGCNMKQLNRSCDAPTRRDTAKGHPTTVPTWRDMATGFPVLAPGWRNRGRGLPALEFDAAPDMRHGPNCPKTNQKIRVFFRVIITSNEVKLDVLIIGGAVSSTGNTMAGRAAGEAHVAFRSGISPMEQLQLLGPRCTMNKTSMKKLTACTLTRETRNMKFAAIKLGDVMNTGKLSRLLEETGLRSACVPDPRCALAIVDLLSQWPRPRVLPARRPLPPLLDRASIIAGHLMEYMVLSYSNFCKTFLHLTKTLLTLITC
ncbi:hypothetical protein O0L34_g3162 [Tuta absoluta]|nr:hypothetical protein O0L34_g3162 [Tuta absoluta]